MIQADIKTIPNNKSPRTYTVSLTYAAFRCRYEMEPANTNFAMMTITYAPNDVLFDFPSFMAYLRSFEDEPISLESAANRVLDDIFIHLRPIWARVHVRTEREHGVIIEIVAEHGQKY
jgi:NADPH-dependent 7-cyano-7-deazaguanine reductase QueF